MRRRVLFLAAGLVLLTPYLCQAASEAVALLTEIRAGQGEVRVKLMGEADWKAPLPLLSLRAGDQLRATQNAAAVVLFTGGQGTVTITPGNSPYTVQPPAGAASRESPPIVGTLSRILMGKKKDLNYVPLTTRSAKQPPLALSPRGGKLLGPPTLEWSGSDRARYAVRVFGPQGLLWQQSDLSRRPLPYPASAPALSPGVAYRWELETKDFPVEKGQFSLLAPREVADVRQTLASLVPAVLPGYPKNTIVLMRAGFLLDKELLAEARQELLSALARDPDEPGLHLMLGEVYEQTGLPGLAGEEFDEAQFLSSKTP